MIANHVEMMVAVRQLRIMEEALQALRNQLATSNPDLLAATEKSYVYRITSLQTEISHYLCDHPTEVSRLMQLTEYREPKLTEESKVLI